MTSLEKKVFKWRKGILMSLLSLSTQYEVLLQRIKEACLCRHWVTLSTY